MNDYYSFRLLYVLSFLTSWPDRSTLNNFYKSLRPVDSFYMLGIVGDFEYSNCLLCCSIEYLERKKL